MPARPSGSVLPRPISGATVAWLMPQAPRLGRHRWVVERTLAWLNRFRRLTIRYERDDRIHEALLTLGCALICFNALNRD